MIVTVEGYNGKKNKSVRTASELAAFSAIKNGDKTLVINLINPDIDTAERMLAGVGMEEELQTDYKNNVSDDGIDSLLRQAETRMLTEEDIDKYVLPMFLHLKNRLDVATVTKNKSFNDLLLSEARFLALKRVILSARDVYENLILILDSKEKEVNDNIKALDEVDVNVVCLKQGFTKHAEVTGKNIVYVVSDYDSRSKFNLKSIEREFSDLGVFQKGAPVFKIANNIYAQDAAIAGDIIHFVGRNKEANEEDINFEWINDELALMNYVFNNKKTEKKELQFEKKEEPERTFKEPSRKHKKAVLAEIEDEKKSYSNPPINEPKKKKGFGLFGRKKAQSEVSYEEAPAIEDIPANAVKESEDLNTENANPKSKDAPKKRGPKPIKVDGVEYASLKAACDAYDKGYNEVYAKLKAGETIKSAFGLE